MFLGGALSNEQRFTNAPESARATTLVQQSFPGDQHTRELVIVRSTAATVDDAGFRGQVQAVAAKVMGLGPDVVLGSVDYTTDPSPVLVSADRHAALLLFTMARSGGDVIDDAAVLEEAAREAARRH